MLEYTYKSLEGGFPRDLTPDHRRQDSRFGKTWKQILEDLDRELRLLGYRYGSCVIQTAHTPYDVRNDGRLRADARRPEHPGAVVRFDVYDKKIQKYIPMAFGCDQFTDYQSNVQAIAGAMEALRKVDRYAVSSRGKSGAHYEGYKALPTAEGKIGDTDQAVEFVAQHSGVPPIEIRSSQIARDTAFRKAARKLHPDGGGNQEEFIKLTDARRFLEQL